MAPRRSYRSVKVDNNNVNINLVLNDVLCPICRSILIEPVTIPCSHGFCLSCFEGTVANANLTCPLCRVRFGSWHRLAKKENKVVNINLWQTIKNTFPHQVENKLNGVEENLEEEQPIRLASPGQIRKEYEEQRKKDLLEIQKRQEADSKASEDLIKKIVEEEALHENQIRSDEQYAQKLENQINSFKNTTHNNAKHLNVAQKSRPLNKFLQNAKTDSPKTSICIKTFSKVEATESKKECVTKILCQGNRLAKYTQNIKSETVTKNGTMNNMKPIVESNKKTSIIANESRYFKPIDVKNISPSKVIPILRVPAKLNEACTAIIGAPTGKIDFTHNHLLSAFARFEMTSPILGVSSKESTISTERNQNRKRRLSKDISNTENINVDETVESEECSTSIKHTKVKRENSLTVTKRPCIRRSNRILSMDKSSDRAATIHHIERSPNTRSKQKIINKIVEECINEGNSSQPLQPESPPCRGFERVNTTNLEVGKVTDKKMQEDNDFELAKKLQEELNKERYPTRNSIIQTNKFCKKHRQMKLEEMVSCRNKVK